MYGWKPSNGNYWFWQQMKKLFVLFFQLAQGFLLPSSNLLRMIEEVAAEDETNLQLGFDTYDGCSGKSTSLDFFILAI